MKTFTLIGKSGTSKIYIKERALDAKHAIKKSEKKYPDYKFLTTESGEMGSGSLVTILNLMSIKQAQ